MGGSLPSGGSVMMEGRSMAYRASPFGTPNRSGKGRGPPARPPRPAPSAGACKGVEVLLVQNPCKSGRPSDKRAGFEVAAFALLLAAVAWPVVFAFPAGAGVCAATWVEAQQP